MDTSFLTRAYLETLSSSELISIGDDFGIDIPKDLDRSFIIAELLEVSQEIKREEEISLTEPIGKDMDSDTDLPSTYNETHIQFVLRNPVWAYVFWDISAMDIENLEKDFLLTGIKISASFFDSDSLESFRDSFDVEVELSDREQFFLLPAGRKYLSVALVAQYDGGKRNILATTGLIHLPEVFDSLLSSFPLATENLTEIQKLSGKDLLLRQHFENHRQSFS